MHSRVPDLNMRRFAAFLLCTLTAIPPAHAWNGTGHMMVAAIGYDLLTPQAKAEVNRLLRMNPDYQKWIAGAGERDRNEIVFVMASTWPDVIKSRQDYTGDAIASSGEDASRNIGYVDKLQHRYWHTVHVPFSADGSPSEEPPAPNALTQITAFRSALSLASTSDNVKSYDLVWLLHLVGDVHQPLHAISRFTHADPNGDDAGNAEMVCIANCDGNVLRLHAYWDDLLGPEGSAEAAIAAANKIPQAPGSEAAAADEGVWIHESFELAKRYAYASPVGDGNGPYALTADYEVAAARITQQRIALAGARLANLLNSVLK
jgi:S1/P1 nuclease